MSLKTLALKELAYTQARMKKKTMWFKYIE